MTMPIIRLVAGMALATVAQPIGASPTVAPPSSDAAVVHPFAAHVSDAARRFGIPEVWIWAVMRVESRGNPRAVSPAGAMGLMQIMPATWAILRARYDLGTDAFDPHDNIVAGAAFLRQMHDRYGNPTAMLAAYNAGPGRYDDYIARGRPLPAETRAYVAQLADIIGGSSETQIAAESPPDPFAWRRAALFIRTAERSVAGTSSDAPPDRRSNDSPAAGPIATEVQPDSLFVRHASTARPQ
ncbi:lytic transglycosylase domain-containing protein [Sphingobium aquiterrae]|uniref:lytic transglycosylase domain-containing protein n=1 Tax=Sphingobium aquiterrae TaxID=2038656 RepID=UPI003015F5A2